jgi:superfamily I DNA/RNA helicase
MKVFIHNDIRKQIAQLYSWGGQFQKAAERCKSLIYDLDSKTKDPIEALNKIGITHNGETRIKHAIKYDLPGFCRLVTIQDKGYIALVFLGKHEDVDNWLNTNRGLELAINDPEKGIIELLKSEDIRNPEARINPLPDYSGSFLYEKLKHHWIFIAADLPNFIVKHLKNIDSTTDEDHILEVVEAIENNEKQNLIFDVFLKLRGGLVDEAKNLILEYKEEVKTLSDLPVEIIDEIRSNDQFISFDELEAEDMKILMSNKNWLDWMLFMHPAQKKVVERDFAGSARLLGVSGSGKTCIVVRRAVRMAKKYPGQKILVLTLNEALARLIFELVDQFLECSEDFNLRDFIEVKSFWELCRELLIEYRNHPLDTKVLGPKTDKQEESIEEIWEEYYKCEYNNNDAEVLFPLHQTLLVRSVFPNEYLKQEFDWIRSFLALEERDEYIKVQRENRAIPFNEGDRALVLKGLYGWENKMSAVGAIDYLGLASELYKINEKLSSKYRCILVDEIQDFGTLELKLIRKLTEKQENDLFLCGDIAQQVYNKHHQIRSAGINISPDAYLKILKNYRNSREILTASYELFQRNIDSNKLKSDEFEVLNPEFANFSSAKPFLRKGKSIHDEFLSAVAYLNENLDEKERGCIAFCDYSIFSLEHLCKSGSLQLLDGSSKLGSAKIYLSDLEQTKGFEFDRMIIINATKGIFPNPLIPEEECYREISKFYVAMTRAKKELIISYSNSSSALFDNCKEFFLEDFWTDHIIEYAQDDSLVAINNKSRQDAIHNKLTAKEFLHQRKAVGMSRDAQNKLMEVVQGKAISERGNKKIGWRNVHEMVIDIKVPKDRIHYSKLFGPSVFDEIMQIF